MQTNEIETAREPLVIDLERDLLRSDLALETIFALLKEEPARALRLLGSLFSTRRHAVASLEACQDIDPATIPYNADVIARIIGQRRLGTPVVLTSCLYDRYARSIATHLQLFDKVDLQRDHARPAAIDASAPAGVAANSMRQTIMMWISAMRLHQWLKNLLIFVPLFASHWVTDKTLLFRAGLAFVLFGLCASSVYLLNDILDLHDDRHHPTKRRRAIALGRISIRSALLAVTILLSVSFATACYVLPAAFSSSLIVYYIVTLTYSVGLKRIMMLDVVILAMLYTLRMIAGTLVIKGELTFWMLAFSLFIFMSLALVKRYTELIGSQSIDPFEKARGRGYIKADLPMIAALGAASGYLSVMILALYIQDPKTIGLYSHPKIIWFACPLLLFWISRTWMLTHRGLMHDDPIVFAVRDRVSLAVAACFGLVFLLAA